jgi:hypothetical protein
VIDRDSLEAGIRPLNEELRALVDFGVEMSGPGWFEKFKARAAEYREQEPEREAKRQETDRFLPELLDLYRTGADDDREWVRDLLRACPTFRWGFGWRIASPKPPVSAEDMIKALALLSIKDGGADPRDQQVLLDKLCAATRQSGLDLPPLLRKAAAWSSGEARFPPMRSTRALLLDYAERLVG